MTCYSPKLETIRPSLEKQGLIKMVNCKLRSFQLTDWTFSENPDLGQQKTL